jgi:hypothetical protein
MSDNDLATVLARLDRIEAALQRLFDRQAVRDWYTTEEVAGIVGKGSGPGKCQSWGIGREKDPLRQ